MAATPVENQIMDLWDQGRSIEQIARSLQITRKRAALIVGTYYDQGERTRAERAMIAGSAKLLAAMNQARMAA